MVKIFTFALIVSQKYIDMLQRPLANEYAPYFSRYIDLVPEGDFFEVLSSTFSDCISAFENLPIEKHEFRYAEGKWTPKEMLMHMIDTERIFVYRALAISRGDKTALPGFDENEYVASTDVSSFALADLLTEFTAVRTATMYFFKHIPTQNTLNLGIANNYPTSSRALGYMVIGHVIHHQQILRERYLMA